jgi:hypothetical protein
VGKNTGRNSFPDSQSRRLTIEIGEKKMWFNNHSRKNVWDYLNLNLSSNRRGVKAKSRGDTKVDNCFSSFKVSLGFFFFCGGNSLTAGKEEKRKEQKKKKNGSRELHLS